MAKALKVAALVVGAVALGVVTAGAGLGLGLSLATTLEVGTFYVSAGALLLGAAVLEVGATLLSKKGSTTSSQSDRLTTSLDPRAFRKTVYGRTAFANDLRYEEWFGADQEYCGWIIALASHRIESLDEIWINQEQAWSLTGGVAAKYRGYFYVQRIVKEGGPNETFAVSTPDAGKWNSSSRLTGCAFVFIQFRVTGVDKKATSPFSSGLPSRITFIGRGAMMYDPRRDDTAGGSGAMRATDQSSWRYTSDDGVDLGPNIPLMILRELLGWKITNPTTGVGRLAVGAGLPPSRIDLPSFQIAAGIADEQANRSAGGTEPKFHGGACLSEGDDLHSRLDMLCAACNGRLRDVNGKLALVIMHNDLANAASDDGLNDDDVIGAFTWESDPPLDQCVNVVRGKFTDPSTTSLFQMIDYPDVSLPSPDGIDRVMQLDLSVAQSASHAQRVVKQVLERRQYQRTFSAPFDIRAWKYQVGDVVPFTFTPLSFARRLFRVASQELGQDGQCMMALMDENQSIYAWDADDAPPVVAAAPIVYDPLKDPLVQAISAGDSAALQIAIANSYPIGLTITAAADGTITISDHIRRYNDGHADVAVQGTTLSSTGLSAGDFRAIGYDDPARLGYSEMLNEDGSVEENEDGSVAVSEGPLYHLYADDIDARASPAHPGRHYVGYAVIPTAGSPPADGGGASPPGGRCVTVDTPVLMADGSTKPAGQLAVGDRLRTRHEARLAAVLGGWGAFPVEAIEIAPSDDVWEATIGGRTLRATGDHLVYTGSWVAMRTLGSKVEGTFDIVKLTVTDAHTYVSNGVLSHNIKQQNEALE